MNTRDLITHIQDSGFCIDCDDSGLLVSPADQLTEELKQLIRENKPAILAELHTQRVLEEALSESEKKYSVLVTDASTDPVLVKVGIRGIGTFDMEIPKANYDGLALLEVVEQYSLEAEPKAGTNVYLLPDNRSAA